MKTNKILISIIGIFCIFTSSIQAKDSYYYYNRNRISLKLYEDSVTVYHTIKGTDGQLVYASQNLSSQDQRSSLADTTITSVEYIIMETKNRLVKMSNRFYVQLFNPIEDIHHLQNIANKTHSIVLGPIPNMPDWYELNDESLYSGYFCS